MDCSTFPELDLAEWGAELQKQLKGRRYPLTGMLELTDRCNLNCGHCYINQPAASKLARAGELTTAQIKNILDQVADAGCLFLTLTGGEVLLRPDFSDIYLHARQRGILVSIFTNGTLFSQRIVDLLAEDKPTMIEITLYGATQETYEQVTNVPGSYDRCMKSIELLLERGLPLFLKSALLTINRLELSDMQAFADKLGVKYRYDGVMWPRLNGDQQPFNFQLSPEELVSIDLEDPKRMEEMVGLADVFHGQLVRSENVYICGGGLQSFSIDSKGKLKICGMSRQPAYDINEMGFMKAWERLGEVRKLKLQTQTTCRTCKLGALCSQCPAWSQAIYGDEETPVDFLCKLAHLRAEQVENMQYAQVQPVNIER